VLYQLEPDSDSLRIFAQGFLIVVLLIELDFELRSALNKVGSSVMANRILVILSEQRISHIFDCSELGQKSLHVKVKDMLDNCQLFCWNELHQFRLMIALRLRSCKSIAKFILRNNVDCCSASLGQICVLF
jgi:hypothetical protein